MAVRRFGVTLAAGTAVIEEPAQPSIQVASLGNTAYTGIMQKGPVGKAFRAKTATEFAFRGGGVIPESLLPDAAQAFFRRSRGAGALWFNRLTDGTEAISEVTLKNRRSPKGDTLKVKAGNGGRWAGKAKLFVRNYSAITATTLTLASAPALKLNELAGALVTLSAVPGKSFKVISNSTSGILTFEPDVNLVAEVSGSGNMLVSVSLANEGEAIGVKIMEGTANPTTEFRMQVYFIEGGVSSLVKDFDDLSCDPNADNYYVRLINDNSDADFTVKVEDLHSGSITADVRPANFLSLSEVLTATVLTAKITNESPNSVLSATAKAKTLALGGSVVPDSLTLTVTTAGARASQTATFSANPADGDTALLNGKTVTFKTVVITPASQVLIGANAEATMDNYIAFVNAKALLSTVTEWFDKIFAVKLTSSTMKAWAQNAGLAGNAFTSPAGAGTNPPVWGASTLSGGVNQVWSVASESMPFLSLAALTTGVAYAGANEYGFGFTLQDTSKSATKTWAVADTLEVEIAPLPVSGLVGGALVPKASVYRTKFAIVSNTANTITVRTGSDMTALAVTGDQFRVEYVQQLGGGYDGNENVADLQYQTAYDTATTPLKGLRNRNLGLVKLATPGVSSSAVQKAGCSLAEAQNWQYRLEIPSNIVSEDAAEKYVNETVGRNDFAVVTFPTYAYVTHPSGNGLKLVSEVGEIHGAEASVAKNFNGFHKAAAGEDVTLPDIRALQPELQDKLLDEESLNPQGIGIIKKLSGNFVLWGDRTVSIDPAFKFKHQRETLSHWENTFLENFNFIIFALNNKQTQTRLISAFLAFFQPEFANGAIEGKSLQDAVRLKIDAENNTDATRANGDLFASLSPKIVDTVERLIIKVSKRGVEEVS